MSNSVSISGYFSPLEYSAVHPFANHNSFVSYQRSWSRLVDSFARGYLSTLDRQRVASWEKFFQKGSLDAFYFFHLLPVGAEPNGTSLLDLAMISTNEFGTEFARRMEKSVDLIEEIEANRFGELLFDCSAVLVLLGMCAPDHIQAWTEWVLDDEDREPITLIELLEHGVSPAHVLDVLSHDIDRNLITSMMDSHTV